MPVVLVTRLQGYLKLSRVELRVTVVLLAPLVRGVRVVLPVIMPYIQFASRMLMSAHITEMVVRAAPLGGPQGIRGRVVPGVVGVGYVIPLPVQRVETPGVVHRETAGYPLTLLVRGVAGLPAVLLLVLKAAAVAAVDAVELLLLLTPEMLGVRHPALLPITHSR